MPNQQIITQGERIICAATTQKKLDSKCVPAVVAGVIYQTSVHTVRYPALIPVINGLKPKTQANKESCKQGNVCEITNAWKPIGWCGAPECGE